MTKIFLIIKLQVHSLTARSVSREFREGLRLSHPSPPNMNIKVTPNTKSPFSKGMPIESKIEEQLKECDTETFNNTCVSDSLLEVKELESQSNDESEKIVKNNDVLTSAALNKAKRSTSNSILSRAAFWDKRVQDGIIDGDVAIKQFPKVDRVVVE